MARRFSFEDPNDRSPKDYYVDVPSDRVLALYNQDNDPKAQRLSENVRKWFIDEAKKLEWDKIEFSNTNCRLTNERVRSLYVEHS